jgi:hypothetical protein
LVLPALSFAERYFTYHYAPLPSALVILEFVAPLVNNINSVQPDQVKAIHIPPFTQTMYRSYPPFTDLYCIFCGLDEEDNSIFCLNFTILLEKIAAVVSVLAMLNLKLV